MATDDNARQIIDLLAKAIELMTQRSLEMAKEAEMKGAPGIAGAALLGNIADLPIGAQLLRQLDEQRAKKVAAEENTLIKPSAVTQRIDHLEAALNGLQTELNRVLAQRDDAYSTLKSVTDHVRTLEDIIRQQRNTIREQRTTIDTYNEPGKVPTLEAQIAVLGKLYAAVLAYYDSIPEDREVDAAQDKLFDAMRETRNTFIVSVTENVGTTEDSPGDAEA